MCSLWFKKNKQNKRVYFQAIMLLPVYSNRFLRNHTGMVVPRVFTSCWKFLAFDQIQLDAYCAAVWRRFEATFNIYIYIYIHAHTHKYIYIYIYGYIYKYMYTHTHTYTHIYIYISKLIVLQRDLYFSKEFFFSTYVYISSLLPLSGNIRGTSPLEWGTQWESNSLV